MTVRVRVDGLARMLGAQLSANLAREVVQAVHTRNERQALDQQVNVGGGDRPSHAARDHSRSRRSRG